MANDLLFSKHCLSNAIREWGTKLRSEIQALTSDEILNADPEKWCDYFEEKYRLDVPRLDESAIEADQKDSKVDVSHDESRYISDRSRPFHIEGTTFSFFVPFQGDSDLFRFRPSTFTFNPPRATVRNNEITFSYCRTDHNSESVRRSFDQCLKSVKQYLDNLEKDAKPYNESLRGNVRALVGQRREKLLKDQQTASDLGFPMRRRDGAPKTYVLKVKTLSSVEEDHLL